MSKAVPRHVCGCVVGGMSCVKITHTLWERQQCGRYGCTTRRCAGSVGRYLSHPPYRSRSRHRSGLGPELMR